MNDDYILCDFVTVYDDDEDNTYSINVFSMSISDMFDDET